jgi:hypothetical protein
MAGILLRRTRFDGAIDVHNRVTLVNDIMNGSNRNLMKKIDCTAAMRWRSKGRFEGV